MSEHTLGITFSETMTGGFSLDETDPTEGEKKGNKSGNTLALHATILIDDLDRFTSDPDHAGSITGSIDFTPFGNSIPARAGAFNLFSPSGDPRLKHMIYELAFEHEGESYYLAGKKEVRDDPGLDMWKDTTTLFTKLHKGTNKSGQVVGAGILSLGVKELAKMVSTMKAVNAQSATEQASAVLKFGRFFMGDLWDSYVIK
jgi:cholesterol oxidase